MSEIKFSPKLLAGIIIVIFFDISLYFRTLLPYDQVFSGEWIKFTGIDAYYHMNLVDNLAHNFPRLISFNPYFIYPGGAGVGNIHLFDQLLASVIWIIGLGSPTQHTIDVVSVYFPAVLAALTVIPVYFIGKELFGCWAGIIAAGFIALVPGEYLGRSILGFTDHHVAEVLFTTLTVLFLILAIKTAKHGDFTLGHIRRRDWAISAKPIVYSLLAGIFLGLYFFTWIGALLLVFIISLYFIIQFIIDHLKHQSTDYLCLTGAILFFVALLTFMPSHAGRFYIFPLIIAIIIPLLLYGISRLVTRWKLKPVYFPVAIVVVGLAGLGILYAIVPSLLNSMLNNFSIFAPSEVSRTTIEMQSFLFPEGDFTIRLAWGNFTTGFYLSLIALVILIWAIIRQFAKGPEIEHWGITEKSLLVIWSLVMLLATLQQRRFAYYLAVNVALLTGYISVIIYHLIHIIAEYLGGKSPRYIWGQILDYAGFKKLVVKPSATPKREERKMAGAKPKTRHAADSLAKPHPATVILAVIVIFFLVLFPNITPANVTASGAYFAPSDAWMESLTWMRDNTPEPFGNPDHYYEFYEPPKKGERYKYPESAYGVLAWWDYGYWITRTAHRIPNANPSQDPVSNTKVARFFTSQDADSADEIIQELESEYVVIDYDTATSKFWAIATWAGSEQAEFIDVYVLPQENQYTQVQLFYPEYYRSMSNRLYNFDGKAVTPDTSWVISYEEKTSRTGEAYKEITSVEQFDSYEEAEAYLASNDPVSYRLVGIDPFSSPVPLEALEDYELVHSAGSQPTFTEGVTIPEVKIFKYTGQTP